MTEPDEFVEALCAALRRTWVSCGGSVHHLQGAVEPMAIAVARVALERAAEVVEERSLSFDFQSALAECRDQEAGFHNGRLSAARSIRALLPPVTP